MILTNDQKTAGDMIEKFLSSLDEKLFLLIGPAGTGKTSLVKHVLLNHHMQGKSIAVSSFTNKATNVISGMTPFAKGISLFRLLGLRTEEDTEQLVFEFKGKDKLREFDIVVVDEVSMLTDYCFGVLKKRVEKSRGIKVILMGDADQLPPVQEEDFDDIWKCAEVFRTKNYTPETIFELKEIVRQSKNSSIPKYASYIRKILHEIRDYQEDIRDFARYPIALRLPLEGHTKNDYPGRINDINICNNNSEEKSKENVVTPSDVVLLDDAHDFMNLVFEYFTKEEYSKNSNYAKVVAYRNVVIDNINNKVRNRIWFSKVKPKEALPAILPGENLILNAPAFDSQSELMGAVYDTSDEISVVDVLDVSTLKKEIAGVEFNFPYFLIRSKRNYDGKVATLRVIDPQQKIRFEEVCTACAKTISTKPNAKDLFKNHYYKMKKDYGVPSYSYATTAYKIQGDSIINTFVIEDDIDLIKKASRKALWQAKYVIATRAVEKLFILNRIENRPHYFDIWKR